MEGHTDDDKEGLILEMLVRRIKFIKYPFLAIK